MITANIIAGFVAQVAQSDDTEELLSAAVGAP